MTESSEYEFGLMLCEIPTGRELEDALALALDALQTSSCPLG